MKKFVCFLLLLSIILFVAPHLFSIERSIGAYEMIPDEAIRLRILANSDTDQDQQVKRHVRDAVNEQIAAWVQDIDDIDEARELIASKTEEIESIVEETLTEHNAEQAFTVKYNDNVQFPTKIYGSYLYPAGEYEAVLITLGEGEGSNWWCVLFPPLCFLDFANGTTVEAAEDDLEMKEPEQEVKVKFALLEWLGLS